VGEREFHFLVVHGLSSHLLFLSFPDPSHRMSEPPRLVQSRFAFPLTSLVGLRSNLAKRNVRPAARMQSTGRCSVALTEWNIPVLGIDCRHHSSVDDPALCVWIEGGHKFTHNFLSKSSQ
jgi:hypothetical protein